MEKDIAQIHRRLKRSKFAIFAIVVFLAFLTLLIIAISKNVSEQAMITQSSALEMIHPIKQPCNTFCHIGKGKQECESGYCWVGSNGASCRNQACPEREDCKCIEFGVAPEPIEVSLWEEPTPTPVCNWNQCFESTLAGYEDIINEQRQCYIPEVGRYVKSAILLKRCSGECGQNHYICRIDCNMEDAEPGIDEDLGLDFSRAKANCEGKYSYLCKCEYPSIVPATPQPGM